MKISKHYLRFLNNPKSFPELTNVIRAFVDGESTSSSAGGRVAAGVARVPDVGDVGGQRRPTGGGRDDTADSEP